MADKPDRDLDAPPKYVETSLENSYKPAPGESEFVSASLDTSKQYYLTTWKKIITQNEEQVRRARSILMWLTCSIGLLSLGQLQHALAVSELDPTRLDDHPLLSQAEIELSCLGLVVVTENAFVDFEAASAREFFSRLIEREVPNAHQEIYKTCIRYIQLDGIGNCETFEEIDSSYARFPFLGYAAENWAFHADQADENFQHGLYFTMRAAPLTIERIGRLAISVPMKHHDLSEPLPTSIKLTHIASYFNLLRLLRDCTTMSTDQYTTDSNNWYPLFWAVLGNSFNAAKLIVQQFSALDTFAHDVSHALFWALGERRPSSFKLNRVSITDQVAMYIGDWYPLQIAFAYRNLNLPINTRCTTAMIELLIDNISNIDIQRANGQTPLIKAAQNGLFKYVERILAKGADADIVDNEGMNAALYALQPGSETWTMSNVVLSDSSRIHIGGRIRIDRDKEHNLKADLEEGDMNIENTLIHLLSSDINVSDKSGRSLLHLAAAAGRDKLVAELLSRGATLRNTISGVSPLLVACIPKHRHEVMIDNLEVADKAKIVNGLYIEFGHNPQNVEYVSSACKNALDRRSNVVKLLLEQYSDAFEVSEVSEAFHASASSGFAVISQLLLEWVRSEAPDQLLSPNIPLAINDHKGTILSSVHDFVEVSDKSHLILGDLTESSLQKVTTSDELNLIRAVFGYAFLGTQQLELRDYARGLAAGAFGTAEHGLECLFNGCSAWGDVAQIFAEPGIEVLAHGQYLTHLENEWHFNPYDVAIGNRQVVFELRDWKASFGDAEPDYDLPSYAAAIGETFTMSQDEYFRTLQSMMFLESNYLGRKNLGDLTSQAEQELTTERKPTIISNDDSFTRVQPDPEIHSNLDSEPQLVSWTCSCGARLSDRYIELVPGSLDRLQQELDQGDQYLPLFERLVTRIVKWRPNWRTRTSSQSQPTESGSRFSNPPHQDEIDLGDRFSFLQDDGHLETPAGKTLASNFTEPTTVQLLRPPLISYVLLCIPIGLTGLILRHQQLNLFDTLHEHYVSNDRQFFHKLRERYKQERGTIFSTFWPRTVIRVSLACFQIDMGDYVDLLHFACQTGTKEHDCKCLPPERDLLPAEGAQYWCRPAKAQTIPPLGPNYLTHNFRNPDCIKKLAQKFTVNQVPKRISTCINSDGETMMQAWGLEFEEGWDRDRFYNGFMAIGAVVFVAAVIWSAAKNIGTSPFTVVNSVTAVVTLITAFRLASGPRHNAAKI